MIPFRGNWPPSPELLAAYFDGECEGRDDLTLLKQRLEQWLQEHPEAQAELAGQRRLLQTWQETAPPEPDSTQWASVLAHLQALPPPVYARVGPPPKNWLRRSVWATVTAAVAAVVLFTLGVRDPAPAPIVPAPAVVSRSEEEVFEVAAASEVSIIHVEGADTQTLVVGVLPVQGSLELVTAGDVIMTSMQPDSADNMLPEVRMGPRSTPLIWARVDSEQEEP